MSIGHNPLRSLTGRPSETTVAAEKTQTRLKPKTVAHPMITGADILVEALVRQGVETVFAYPGGASMPMHQSLTRQANRLRTILPRHEQGGIFADRKSVV